MHNKRQNEKLKKKEIGKKTTRGIEFKRKQALRYLRVMEF